MAVLTRTVTVYRCDRCEHEWIPRGALDNSDGPLPVVCSACKSPYWNRPRQNPKPKRRKKRR
jgi:hypothetical protein